MRDDFLDERQRAALRALRPAAERDPEPNLAVVADWGAVRAFFVAGAKAIWRTR